jgi:uncharacterized repeat protein (TIGR03803 family)
MTEPVAGRKPVLALLMRLLWAAALVLPAFGAKAAVVFTTLHSFQAFPNGANPQAALVQGSDGSFYGTTQGGGTNGYGTVFKISTNGTLTSLYSFTDGNDGAWPTAGLVQGSDGYFYGTTSGFDPVSGAPAGFGTVFKMSTNGALTSLYSFTGGNDGANPSSGLVQGSDGYFYGTTQQGGTNNAGTVFKISTDGALTSLYSFTGGNDGGWPYAGLVQGSDGNFYGTTLHGNSSNNAGTVFKISTSGVLTTLYTFTGNDGAFPQGGLVQGTDGYFYGTTQQGGTNGAYGTVFKISSNGVLASLYSFGSVRDTNGFPLDGEYPQAELVQGTDGNFYGTASRGGTSSDGTAFKISTNGVLTILYYFTGNDGAYPQAGLVQGTDGNFYGTTYGGGTNYGNGTVFKIGTNGALTSLYSFTGANDGVNPSAGLVQGSDGSFYGTTDGGGTNGYGTVFKISTNGVLTSLYSFTGGNDGRDPQAGLVQGRDGFFYGTTAEGGTNDLGTVFKIGSNGVLASLYSFGSIQDTNGFPLDGAYPQGGLVQGTDGYFYGTAEYNGYFIGPQGGFVGGGGSVFQISTNGVLNILYSFNGLNDGRNPQAGLVQGSDGFFYGTTAEDGTNDLGTVFKISANGALTSLHSFTGDNDGAVPQAGLVQASDGYLYGTTEYNGRSTGGSSFGFPGYFGYGTVFKISTNGALTTLYGFGTLTNGSGDPLDGANPTAALVQGSDGSFYGTTFGYNQYVGVFTGYGTVFNFSANGAFTILYSFTGGNDGANPTAALVQGSDGSFYGTTSSGGQGGAGTVFRLTIVPQPQLTIIPSGPYMILTWPTNYSGFTLQSSTNLGSSAVWSTNSAVPVVVNEHYAVTNSTSGTQQFYRLSQ